MSKVKFFDHYESTYKLEKDINSFASENKIINVNLTCKKAGYSFYYCAVVIYEE